MTLAEIVEAARAHALERGSLLEAFQSNHEGALIDRLEQLDYDAVICNFGALSHTSYALHDALRRVPSGRRWRSTSATSTPASRGGACR